MNRFITTFAFLVICAGCKNSQPIDLDRYTMEYSLGMNQFGVVVAEDEGISTIDAQKYALKRAAKVAYEHGYQYFTIDREVLAVVMKTEKGTPGQPVIIYYELIQSVKSPEMHLSNILQGCQIEFSCQEKKPSGEHYNVCDYRACD